MILSPSILAADFGILAEQMEQVKRGGAEWLHIDVMDGHFVPNISFAMPVIKSIRKHTDLFFDVHLMIEEPEKYIDKIIESGADMVTFHLEATDNVRKCIDMIHSRGRLAGISIKPKTPVSEVLPYAEAADMILVMTVEPGMGGQKYITEMNDKIRELRAVLGAEYKIEVDGGITAENIDGVLAAGANVIVAGTCVFDNGRVEENVRGLIR